MLVRDRFFIGGQWVAPSGKETIDVHNAGTGEVLGRVPAGGAQDIDAVAPSALTPAMVSIGAGKGRETWLVRASERACATLIPCFRSASCIS